MLSMLVLLASCDKGQKTENTNTTETQKELTKVSLVQEWFPNAGYAGELFAMNETDSTYKLDINLVAGSDNIDPVKLVMGGSSDFGVASADKILVANSKGADLVVVGVINYNSPTCFIAKEELNVKTPKDFEGKTVGILTGTNTEYIYKALVEKQKLNKAKIKEIEAPFDLATFIANQYQIRPAFIYDEPVSLDMQGIKYTIIEPKNYDIHFLGTVYFTTRKMVTEKPEVVQGFVNALADGWLKSFQNPEKAIQYLKAYDKNIDEKRELLSLQKGMDYFKGQDGKVLYASMKEWEEMGKVLQSLSILKNNDINNSVNNLFVDTYHKQK